MQSPANVQPPVSKLLIGTSYKALDLSVSDRHTGVWRPVFQCPVGGLGRCRSHAAEQKDGGLSIPVLPVAPRSLSLPGTRAGCLILVTEMGSILESGTWVLREHLVRSGKRKPWALRDLLLLGNGFLQTLPLLCVV